VSSFFAPKKSSKAKAAPDAKPAAAQRPMPIRENPFAHGYLHLAPHEFITKIVSTKVDVTSISWSAGMNDNATYRDEGRKCIRFL
jgi:hypothetical protein